MNITELVNGLQNNSEAAWCYFDKQFRVCVDKVAKSYRVDADDTYSNAVLRLMRHIHGYEVRSEDNETARKQFTAFLKSYARCSALDIIRKESTRQKYHNRLKAETKDHYFHAVDNKLVESEKMAQVTQALEQLKEKDKQIISMRFIDELSLEEIATHLNCTRNAATVRLHRAIAKLKIELDTVKEAV